MVRTSAILLVGMIACCGGCARHSPPREPAAVFLIVVDTLRPDRLSCYGSSNPTPNISRLAETGVLFSRAQSVASWTVPSMGAMMTSMYPSQLGLVEEPAPAAVRFEPRERRRQLAYTLPLDVQTLAGMLGEAGFLPAGFVNQPFINRQDGFLQGFEAWCYTADEKRLVWHDTGQPIPDIVYPPGTDLGRADSVLVEEFAGWIDSHAGSKPFVWLHLLKPHWPYTPPARYMEDSSGEHGRAPAHERYDGEVRETDDLIGRVLDVIERSVGLERSLIVFTSDHGEEFGEHGSYEHGHSMHREVVHVPLVIAAPGLPAGRRVDDYVRLIDILPTILDLNGFDPALHDRLQGSTLVPLMNDTPVATPPERVVFYEGVLYGPTERGILMNDYKLIFEISGGERYRLYDLSADWLERSDAAGHQGMRAADMSFTLENFRARLREEATAADTIAPGDQEQRVLQSLKALGYIGTD
jgi:arylsulfatase A-like enzyme